MTTPLPRPSSLTTVISAVGILCCVYLAALKLVNVNCPLTGCADIINSRYGNILGIPLPILALPLWIALSLRCPRAWQSRLQLFCALALALGGLILMAIQFFVLRGFCPFCTLHAVAALAVLFALPLKGRAHGWLPAAGLALTLPILLVVKRTGDAPAPAWVPPVASAESPVGAGEATAPRPAFPPSFDRASFRWLGPIDAEKSPILVVSFQCAHCLDLLQQTLAFPRFGSVPAPKLFVYAQPHDAADTIAVIAAILSAPGTPPEQFAAVFGYLDEFRDALVTHDSKELRKRLAARFPNYTEKLPTAQTQFGVQVIALKTFPGKVSPYLMNPDGTSIAGEVTPDLFYR